MLKTTGLVLGGLAVPGVLESCLSSSSSTSSGTIKIGYVSPITGPASGFGEPDAYVIGLAREAFKKGLSIGGNSYSVEIVSRDGQSTPSVGAQVANDLIANQKVDLMLATSTPETVNPVSDACEAAGVPCVSTVVPWEAWYLGRGAKPGQPSPFKWTFHYCFGVAQFFLAYTHLWPQVATNKKVGVMYPNDADGNAIRGALAPLLKNAGYTIVDPGPYEDGTNDYTAQIQRFIREDCQIFNTFPIPPDFATFWRQAAQQGYTKHVKIGQIAKTGLFPSQVTALGAIGNGLASGVYWAPTWPYKSSLTGKTSKQLGDGYESSTQKQWNQQLGASMSMFDVAAAVLNASGNPKDKAKVRDAMKSLKVETPVGNLDWSQPVTFAGTPVPNVVSTPIIGGQWKNSISRWPIDFVICENSSDRNVPIASTLQPYTGS
ncbi:MAG TPA: ABC transporter substrate-binding protein [Candidatus Dormibacteraeota bacterium]|nr:ABC transporter substrate-binding protein [Candidatus Dormibacteraeota bacterium]